MPSRVSVEHLELCRQQLRHLLGVGVPDMAVRPEDQLAAILVALPFGGYPYNSACSLHGKWCMHGWIVAHKPDPIPADQGTDRSLPGGQVVRRLRMGGKRRLGLSRRSLHILRRQIWAIKIDLFPDQAAKPVICTRDQSPSPRRLPRFGRPQTFREDFLAFTI